MLANRQLAVLRAIVEDYVASAEPVGSKGLVERHGLGVSSATVRNDMAILEDAGLIAQPHTSAGRIPTDAGYRIFVDRLSELKPTSAAEKKAITNFLSGAVGIDEVVQRSVRLLAQLTNQIAIVQYPTLTSSTVRHIELVQVSSNLILVVLILSSGRVEQKYFEATEVEPADLPQWRRQILEAVAGKNLPQAVQALTELARLETASFSNLLSQVANEISDHKYDERVAVGGTANLTRFGASFDDTLKPLLEALEEQVVLLHLLGNASTDSVTVRIGQEVAHQQLTNTSVVASGYGPGVNSVAALGVVGPTRMDYPGSITAVRAVAKYVSNILEQN